MHKDTILIACEVVAREMESRLGNDIALRVLDPALHVHPDRLRSELQSAIDQEEKNFATLALGYGLCSRAVEGLKSRCSRMIIPRVDDCIGLFLGSKSKHLNQLKDEPGTFFLSRGWVLAGSTPFEEYEHMQKRFGSKRAQQLMEALLKNYSRLSYIQIDGISNSSEHKNYARSKALQFDLEFQQISGSATLFDKLINGDESPDLQIIEPGNEIRFEMFVT